jgi:hypothetical protein
VSQHPDPRRAILALAEEGKLVPLKGVAGAFVRKLSVEEVDRLATIEKNSGAYLLTMAIVDADGTPLFTADDVPTLLKMKALAFRDISRQVTAENRMDTASLEDAAKN